MTNATDALLALHRAIEDGEHGAALARYFTDDATTLEHPNLITPAGGEYDLAAILQGSERGAALLASQQYDVQDIQGLGDVAIARLTWTGTVAADAGSLTAGQQLVAHIAQFATVRDGRISRIETFDCYEPI
ncbi:nuclear transport factor 2 family protein [Streptosporangium sp. G11]|uniref:nuclear transport factor 2 family protein n=1 Tax=Streptosporangium sp. G11 TaxID=3436926 RepID=UPI003EB73BDA